MTAGNNAAQQHIVLRFYRDDTFIVSYPKSGNTWIRFILANLLAPGETISFRNIDQLIPDIHKVKEKISEAKRPRLIKSHFSDFFKVYSRFIYVYRDGRDVMVSLYFYLLQLGFQGSFSAFLKRRPLFGKWHEHVSLAFAEMERRTLSETLAVRYEDMLEAPFPVARQLANFCRLSVSDEEVQRAVDKCAFESLQEVERKYGPENGSKPCSFFRRGKAGQWQEMFSQMELQRFYEEAGETLIRCGYKIHPQTEIVKSSPR